MVWFVFVDLKSSHEVTSPRSVTLSITIKVPCFLEGRRMSDRTEQRPQELNSNWVAGALAAFLMVIIGGIITFAVSIFEGPINFGKAPT